MRENVGVGEIEISSHDLQRKRIKMRLDELLKSEIIKFPSDQTESTYLETIKKRFSEYRDAIAGLESSPIGDNIKSVSGKINNFCVFLEDSVSLHLLGNRTCPRL